ncbi:MAG: TetR family transcriptional regulator [Chloroflexota bacterium]
MRRRAELVDQTRLRITEAAVRLHTTVGPSNTSISNVAEEAGVTRLTVYRHFKDQGELFDACRRHWYTTNPPPDAAAWQAIPVLEDRARRAFFELYGWYRDHGAELFPIYRDMASMPRAAQDQGRAQWAAVADALVGGISVAPGARRAFRAVAGHLIGLLAWRSLAVEQGLGDEAVEVAVRLLCAAASNPARRTT